MANELTLGRSNLIMPAHYVELDEEEMAYIDGGVSFFTYLKWVGIGLAVVAAAAVVVSSGGLAVGAIATLVSHLGSIATLFKAGIIAVKAFQVAKVAIGIAVSLGTVSGALVSATKLGN